MHIARVIVVFGLVASFSCTEVEPDQGVDAELQVTGAQFVRAALPGENGGPAVKSVSVSPRVTPGTLGKCNGTLDPTATGVAIALEGDRGHWLLPAGIPDVLSPGFPTFDAPVGYGIAIRAGRRQLQVRAVDEQGHYGSASVKTLVVGDTPKPKGELVISLSWDDYADLDLHVVDPSGVEIWKRDISSAPVPKPGTPPEPAAAKKQGGHLDFDSNASCVKDGRRAENVIYDLPPPKGHYLVRVDTFSLCGQPNSYWRVEALLGGTSIGAASGIATETDTRFPHDRGAGVLALEVDVP